MSKIIKPFEDGYNLQRELQKDLNEYSNIFDIIIITMCCVIPFYIDDFIIAMLIFSVLYPLSYINIIINFRKEYHIYTKGGETYSEIIKQHDEIFRKREISDKRNDTNVKSSEK